MRIKYGLILFVTVACELGCQKSAEADYRETVASLTVDATKKIYPFSANMRGANIGNWSFYWGRLYPNDSPKLKELTRLIKPGIIRYAGGLWSNKVMWDRNSKQCYPATPHDGCQRQQLSPPAGGIDRCAESPRPVPRAYDHVYQTDEIDALAAFAKYVGSEIMIEVNMATCDPQMWADMVRYANIEKRYNIRYWELGNEFDLLKIQGKPAPEGSEYVRRYKLYYEAMKAVDPTIQITGPGVASHTPGSAFHSFENFIEPLVNDPEIKSKHMIDLLSYHYYPLWNGQYEVEFAQMQGYDHVPGISEKKLAQSGRKHALECALPMRKVLNAAGMSKVPIAITEFNAIAADKKTSLLFNHANALYVSDMLGRLAFGHADMVLHWELFDLPSADSDGTNFGMISHNKSMHTYWKPGNQSFYSDKFSPMSVYYAYFMYANMFGDMLVETSSSRKEILSIWASIDEKTPGTLKLMVTNMGDTSQPATIALDNFVAKKGVFYTLTNSEFVAAADKSQALTSSAINDLKIDATSAETITRSAQAIIASGKNVKLEGGKIVHEFAPYSVTAFILSQ